MGPDSNPPTKPLYFNCHMCGECCSSWNIPIEAEKAERLLEKPWVQARLQETNRQLTRMTPETYRIPLTDENVCVFLAEDRRCLVEANEGLTLKPHECQRFPFATVRLPDGTDWHETSAACKSISEKLLLAFQPIQPQPPNTGIPASVSETSPNPTPPIAKMLVAANGMGGSEASLAGESKQTQPEALSDLIDPGLEAMLEPLARFPERIPVGGFQSLYQGQYLQYQQQLRDIFMTPGLHPEMALRQAHQRLKQLALARPQTGKAGQSSSSNAPFQSQSQTERFGPAMAGLLTVCFLRKPYRTMSWVNLLLGKTYPDPRIFGMPVVLAKQRQIRWDDSPEAQLNLRVNAFLFNLLQRKRLMALGSSLSAHLAMAGVACLLVQWYAKTLAWLQGGDMPSEADIATAIRLVERYYTGHQPRFLAFFTSRWRGEWMAALLYGL